MKYTYEELLGKSFAFFVKIERNHYFVLFLFQAGVGCDDLGQLHYKIIKDKNGTNIVVITKKIKVR